jgi:hypothetical protein
MVLVFTAVPEVGDWLHITQLIHEPVVPVEGERLIRQEPASGLAEIRIPLPFRSYWHCVHLGINEAQKLRAYLAVALVFKQSGLRPAYTVHHRPL